MERGESNKIFVLHKKTIRGNPGVFRKHYDFHYDEPYIVYPPYDITMNLFQSIDSKDAPQDISDKAEELNVYCYSPDGKKMVVGEIE